jgi:uncharacterized protein with PIN domain
VGSPNAGDACSAEFELPVGLRDLIQSVGIPHVEVGEVTVDGEMAGWGRRIDDGAVIVLRSRYPLAAPPIHPRFVADVHLARLARHLRLLGFDTVWDESLDDPALVECSVEQHRFLLTRDLGLLMRRRLRDGSYVRSIHPRDQLVEVLGRFALRDSIRPFTRCLACNGVIEVVTDSAVRERVPESVRSRHDRLTTCSDCGRVYWPGTHHERMTRLVEEVIGRLNAEGEERLR